MTTHTILAPAKGFTGVTEFGSGPIAFNAGEAVVDDLPAGTLRYLRANGYTVDEHAEGEFDPGQHGVRDVQAYLRDADDEERVRVVLAERAGKARKSVLEGTEDVQDGGDDGAGGSSDG